MPQFQWEDIDHSLVRLRMTNLVEEALAQTKADENRIRFENLGNANDMAVPSLILEMKQKRADEWVSRVYEVYCDVWRTQGFSKSSFFVRAVALQGILPVIRARARAIAAEFLRFARATNFPSLVRDAMLNALQLNMQRLEARWMRRFEIEAKECEHAERRSEAAKTPHTGYEERAMLPVVGRQVRDRQIPKTETSQIISVAGSGTNISKRGRPPRVSEEFVSFAGTLWQNATSGTQHRVPDDQLKQIASSLDAAGHAPPSAYLERKYAAELKAFNSRNSNSKIGPIKTWTGLISVGDKDLERGMRRMLSRCAKKMNG